MKCSKCPWNPPQSEAGDYPDCPGTGKETTWKDGEDGCTLTRRQLEKMDEEYSDYLGDMGDDMGIQMDFDNKGWKLEKALDDMRHMIGLDMFKHKPYRRHGKLFYKPYRNYYESPLSGNPLLDRLPQHVIKATKGSLSMWYELTDSGLRWLGGRLDVTIKTATPYKECPHCGAHLDNGERCDCTENLNGDNSPKENKSYEGAKNNDRN